MNAKELTALLAAVSLFLLVFAFGLRASFHDIMRALGNKSLIMRGIVAINVIPPLAAIGLCQLFSLDPAVERGIIIMAVSPLAPLAPGKMTRGGATVSEVTACYAAWVGLAIIIVPATVAILSHFSGASAALPVVSVAKLVGETILLPLAVGVLIAEFAPRIVPIVAKAAGLIGIAGVLILVALIVYHQRGAAAALAGDGTLLVIALVLCVALAGGHLLGHPSAPTSHLLAMAAAIRHPGIALLIARSNFSDPRISLAIILFLVMSVVITGAYQFAAAKGFLAFSRGS
jgi:BASS family bile acid:Na+ symporter